MTHVSSICVEPCRLLCLNGQEYQEECQEPILSDSVLKLVEEIINMLNPFMTIAPLWSPETTSSL